MEQRSGTPRISGPCRSSGANRRWSSGEISAPLAGIPNGVPGLIPNVSPGAPPFCPFAITKAPVPSWDRRYLLLSSKGAACKDGACQELDLSPERPSPLRLRNPLPSSPIRLLAGISTSSKAISPVSEALQPNLSNLLALSPGASLSTKKIDIPLCFKSGFVLATTIK